jgi:hypothetical protein
MALAMLDRTELEVECYSTGGGKTAAAEISQDDTKESVDAGLHYPMIVRPDDRTGLLRLRALREGQMFTHSGRPIKDLKQRFTGRVDQVGPASLSPVALMTVQKGGAAGDQELRECTGLVDQSVAQGPQQGQDQDHRCDREQRGGEDALGNLEDLSFATDLVWEGAEENVKMDDLKMFSFGHINVSHWPDETELEVKYFSTGGGKPLAGRHHLGELWHGQGALFGL